MECLSEEGYLRCKSPLSECGILSFGTPCEMSPSASSPAAGLGIRSWDRTEREPGSSCWAGGEKEKGFGGLAASWKTLLILAKCCIQPQYPISWVYGAQPPSALLRFVYAAQHDKNSSVIKESQVQSKQLPTTLALQCQELRMPRAGKINPPPWLGDGGHGRGP